MKKENKIPFDKVDQRILQDISGELVSNHVIACQSSLVHELMQREVIHMEEYENYFMSDEKIKECHDVKTDEEIEEIRNEGSDMNEVYEHWLVSDWLLSKLRDQEEVILETDFETWWGRGCSGQAIKLDNNIQKIAYEYSYDERLFENKKIA